MKNSFLVLALAGCLGLTSCTNDLSNNLSTDLTGTYELTSIVVPTSEDFDNDGDMSSNLVSEGSCYNKSWISFRSDGTYEESYSYDSMGLGGLTLTCSTTTYSGTYIQNGDEVNTTPDPGSGGTPYTYTFNASAHVLTRAQTGGSYTGWDNASSLWANLTGNLAFTFTKYTDNENDNGASDSDSDNTDPATQAELIGDFDMVSMVVGTTQDLDDDGDSSTNLITESSCYSAGHINFNANGTYTEYSSLNIIAGGGTSLSCNTETFTGTWIRHGNEIVTRNAASVISHFTLNHGANITLSSSDHNDNYPSFNSTTNLYSMVMGNVDYIYAKD